MAHAFRHIRQMRRLLLVIPLLSVFSFSWAQSNSYIYLYLTNGGVEVYPADIVSSIDTLDNGSVKVNVLTDTVFTYKNKQIDHISDVAPDLPSFTSYGFKKKLNPQLSESHTKKEPTDTMHFNIEGIGKRLLPSFTLSDPTATVYVDGATQQSKVTSLRFDKDVLYTLTYKSYRIIQRQTIKPAVWTEEVWDSVLTELNLTSDMLSTNAPTNHDELLEYLLDGNPSTFFHSTWGDGEFTPLPLDSMTYIDVHLPKPQKSIKFYYMTRPSTNYNPLGWNIYGSHDGTEWTLFKTLTVDDGLPTDKANAEFTSDLIVMDDRYEYLRFEETSSEHKNYIVLSEFRLFAMDNESGEAELIQPAELISPEVYKYKKALYGHNYLIQTHFYADTASVPRMYIDVEGGQGIYDKVNYKNATIRIEGNGVYDDFEEDVWIRGRGNSSWGASKKPYRLKFAYKVNPFGLTKGKNWVLLANAQYGSMLSNVVGHRIGQMVGTPGANDIIPVDLYLNGQYVGNYNFTQKVGLANNSVDIDEDKGFMLELDQYYDEPYRFYSTPYSLPTNIKDPNLDESPFAENPDFYVTSFRTQLNAYCEAVRSKEDITRYIDVDAFTKYLYVNDLILNYEIFHPKSTFLYKDHYDYQDSRFTWGPIWDLDWAFGYEGNSTYFEDGASNVFFNMNWSGKNFFKLVFDNTPIIQKNYNKVAYRFLCDVDLLFEYISDYYSFVAPSLKSDNDVWYSGCDYAEQVNNMKIWIKQRAQMINDTTPQYVLSDYSVPTYGDVNNDERVSISDVVCLVNYRLGDEKAEFVFSKADANRDKEITEYDEKYVAKQSLQTRLPVEPIWKVPFADYYLESESTDLVEGEDSPLQLMLMLPEDCESEDLTAFSCDIILPEGVTLSGVDATSIDGNHKADIYSPGNNLWRIIVYSSYASTFTDNSLLCTLQLKAEKMVGEEDRFVTIQNSLVAKSSGDEMRLDGISVPFSISSGIQPLLADYSIRGGDALYVEALNDTDVEIFTVNGIRHQVTHVTQGKTIIHLPKGIYIVNGQKLIVR